MQNRLLLSLALCTSSLAVHCGGSASPPKTADTSGTSTTATSAPTASPTASPQEAAEAVQPCGTGDTTTHDLSATQPTQALTPCAGTGKADYSGMIQLVNVPGGVRIIIKAKDDEVNLLGADATTRDAVLVYPKGKGSQSVEVPLVKTADGYSGDKIILWNDLGAINDDGTKLDVAIFDNDKSSGKPSEEMHVAVAISAGMSCDKASKAFPQHEGAQQPDISQLQKPMHTKAFDAAIGSCNAPNSTSIKICAEVQAGKVVGASVKLSPNDNGIAVCMDRATRALSFPSFGEPAQVTWVSKGN